MAGRPTLYDPDYDEIVIKLGKEGKTKVEIASHFDVNVDTISDWETRNASFLQAMLICKAHAETWWLAQGRAGLWEEFQGPKLNTKLYELNMRNRFGHHEKIEQSIELQTKEAQKLTTEELIRLYQESKPDEIS
jgi:hypothetical protein